MPAIQPHNNQRQRRPHHSCHQSLLPASLPCPSGEGGWSPFPPNHTREPTSKHTTSTSPFLSCPSTHLMSLNFSLAPFLPLRHHTLITDLWKVGISRHFMTEPWSCLGHLMTAQEGPKGLRCMAYHLPLPCIKARPSLSSQVKRDSVMVVPPPPFSWGPSRPTFLVSGQEQQIFLPDLPSCGLGASTTGLDS